VSHEIVSVGRLLHVLTVSYSKSMAAKPNSRDTIPQ